jgi:tetratricopeptide (TPR) repeat protein
LFSENKNRKVIPRWRDFTTTTALGELSSPSASRGEAEVDARKLVTSLYEQWQSHPTIWYAGDVLSAALVLGVEGTVRDVAQFVIDHSAEAPQFLVRIAHRIHSTGRASKVLELPTAVTTDPATVNYEQIRLLRRRLGEEPRNSIVWTDLSRLYSLVGQYPQAEKAMRMACSISPTNRFVLRSASRLFLHLGEPEFPLRLMRRNSPVVTRDPWLLAAEISISSAARIGSYYAKTGLKTIGNENLSDFAKTELTSAIATLEFESGKHRNAKRLFRNSLVAPNENSLAQAEWASRNLSGIDSSKITSPVPRAFEAECYRDFYAENWELSFANALGWFEDQPFSTRAATFVTYLSSSILEEYDRSERLLHAALVSNPDHPMLLNNLTFALANMGKLDDAEREFAKIDIESGDPQMRIVLSATLGLLSMRRGRLDEGRLLYRQAMEGARLAKNRKYRALASIHLAREEGLANTELFPEALALAEKEGRDLQNEPDIQLLLRRLRGMRLGDAKEASGT